MLIKVTRKHINKGRRRTVSCCPIALAIKEATGRDVAVGCSFTWERGADDEVTHEAPLSVAAQEFIRRFDKHGKLSVAPATFRIDL